MKSKKWIIVPIVSLVAVACAFLAVMGVALGTVAYANITVLSVDGDIVEDISKKDWDSDYDYILVLGAGLRSDGTPSDMLADRLKIAYGLYERGASNVIVLSGDRSGEDYDEVTAMRVYLEGMGIPKDAIIEDGKGYSTYESVFNLNEAGNYDKIVIVTQKYHLYRAVFIAEEMGIYADGADAAIRGYRNQLYRDLREVAARTKDFFMVKLDGGAL